MSTDTESKILPPQVIRALCNEIDQHEYPRRHDDLRAIMDAYEALHAKVVRLEAALKEATEKPAAPVQTPQPQWEPYAFGVTRLAVDGGWLYSTGIEDSEGALCFVPWGTRCGHGTAGFCPHCFRADVISPLADLIWALKSAVGR